MSFWKTVGLGFGCGGFLASGILMMMMERMDGWQDDGSVVDGR